MISANVSWRWVYALGCFYQGFVTIAIFLFGEETYVLTSHLDHPAYIHYFRLYDRKLSPVPKPNTHGVRRRVETLTGITGIKLRRFRMSFWEAVMQPLLVFIRPNMFLMSVYIACVPPHMNSYMRLIAIHLALLLRKSSSFIERDRHSASPAAGSLA
jgi:hypothetical protein